MTLFDKDADQVEVGVKYDEDKPMYSLLPPDALRMVVEVLTYGANKYSPDNWNRVDDLQRRYYDASMRHQYADLHEAFDESGYPHLAHAICCLLFKLQDHVNNGRYDKPEDEMPLWSGFDIAEDIDHVADAMTYMHFPSRRAGKSVAQEMFLAMAMPNEAKEEDHAKTASQVAAESLSRQRLIEKERVFNRERAQQNVKAYRIQSDIEHYIEQLDASEDKTSVEKRETLEAHVDRLAMDNPLLDFETSISPCLPGCMGVTVKVRAKEIETN